MKHWPSYIIKTCSFLFFAYSTYTVVFITMGFGVRDSVHAICNASAWCHALYPCLVLYINLHLAPILLFPSCHPAYKRGFWRRNIQNSTFKNSREDTFVFSHFGRAIIFIENGKTPTPIFNSRIKIKLSLQPLLSFVVD